MISQFRMQRLKKYTFLSKRYRRVIQEEKEVSVEILFMGSSVELKWDWHTSQMEFERIRQVYRCVHSAIQIGALTAVLEGLLPSFLPLDVVREIAVKYYEGGGTIHELETSRAPQFLFWDHPFLWDPLPQDRRYH